MSILKKQDKEDMFENLNFVKFQLDLKTFYLIKGFLSPICYWDDYATMFGVVAKK
ncbi:MAG: hypothetical protein L6V95_02030 [Candidatus Melainabacteria bacterium]|nr:MAG: hypothetical protein L6V95_02030 [Candidatus Melainabacteria bacterium]